MTRGNQVATRSGQFSQSAQGKALGRLKVRRNIFSAGKFQNDLGTVCPVAGSRGALDGTRLEDLVGWAVQ